MPPSWYQDYTPLKTSKEHILQEWINAEVREE